MKRYLYYGKDCLRHKWFVFLAGVELGVPLLSLILHDWDKFTPRMFIAYARCFRKPNGEKQYEESDEFSYTWNRHQKINKHHWQSSLLTWDRGDTVALPMDENDIKEMVADWIGAGRAYGSTDTVAWYLERIGTPKLVLHPRTQNRVEELLGIR